MLYQMFIGGLHKESHVFAGGKHFSEVKLRSIDHT